MEWRIKLMKVGKVYYEREARLTKKKKTVAFNLNTLIG